MSLNKEAILKSCESKMIPAEVPVPEWGGSVWVLPMTGVHRDKLEALTVKQRTGGDPRDPSSYDVSGIRAWTVAQLMVDEAGNNIFSPDDPDEVAELNALPCAGLNRIWNHIQQKNFLGADGIAKAGKA